MSRGGGGTCWPGRAADDVFAFGRLPEDDRNIMLGMFANPKTRTLFGPGWAEEARRMVAQFRATHDVWAGDPAFVVLLDRLTQASSEFRRWWQAHEVRVTASGRTTLHHPLARWIRRWWRPWTGTTGSRSTKYGLISHCADRPCAVAWHWGIDV